MSRAVLDANVFIRGKASLGFDELYTVPEVESELESRGSRMNLQVKDIEVRSPSKEVLERVKAKSSEVGATTSAADERLLALAIDLEAVLVTDDMDLQNLALHMDADFESYMGDEVKEMRSWKRVCENCGAATDSGSCPRCGSTQFRRKLDQYSSG